jgi:[ribosomal protein S5]-alanine N-acetyltransferase
LDRAPPAALKSNLISGVFLIECAFFIRRLVIRTSYHVKRMPFMLKPPNILETPRLLLRLPVMSDAEPIFRKYAQDPQVTKYLVWRPHERIEVTREFVQDCILSWDRGNAFPWVAARKDDDEVVGMFELRVDQFRADFGYVIAREYWGCGYATEITRAVIEWVMRQGSIYRVWAVCDIENAASARVMEKAGLQREGVLRRYMVHPNISAEPRDVYCYALVKP